jgi:hypothetical protein
MNKKSMVGGSSGIDSIKNNFMKKTFTEMVSAGLVKYERIERDGRLWASQVGVCARKGALAAIEKKNEVRDPSFYAFCELGITIEKIVLHGIENDGYLISKKRKYLKVPAIRGLNLGGYIDALAVQKGDLWCLEVKSAGNFVPSSPKSTFKSFHTHKGQVLLYSALTGLNASLFYFSRQPAGFNGWLNIKQFDFIFSEPEDYKQIRQALFNAVYARECLNVGILPDKSAELEYKSNCGFCNYTWQCWEDEPIVSELRIGSAQEKYDTFARAFDRTDRILEKAPQRRLALMNRLKKDKSIEEQLRKYNIK